MATKGRRGPYSKGIARRAEILRVALEAYQASGRQGPSLKSIADAVGLTEAGVLHYFGSKDELLVEILVARDREYLQTYDLSTPDGVWALLDHTTRTPGLVKLFVDMTAASADPAHPAHPFMRRRTRVILDLLERVLGPGREWQARILLAAAEGLQIQWLRDPSTDIIGDLKRLAVVLGMPLETIASSRGSGAARP
ncbi:TetR/AcrR family transcriptional regulator [Actinomadura napierensis]|uniref:TetR/AcrR family transcriptional regulator n=1 Tax=Actinomadura napierensis TaxID=267854 RepID=A0ABN2XX00_9ACTN